MHIYWWLTLYLWIVILIINHCMSKDYVHRSSLMRIKRSLHQFKLSVNCCKIIASFRVKDTNIKALLTSFEFFFWNFKDSQLTWLYALEFFLGSKRSSSQLSHWTKIFKCMLCIYWMQTGKYWLHKKLLNGWYSKQDCP